MSSDKRNLNKEYRRLIDDIFDNFDKYTSEEKNMIKDELNHLVSLNDLLEKYDKKSSNIFDKIKELWDRATGGK